MWQHALVLVAFVLAVAYLVRRAWSPKTGSCCNQSCGHGSDASGQLVQLSSPAPDNSNPNNSAA